MFSFAVAINQCLDWKLMVSVACAMHSVFVWIKFDDVITLAIASIRPNKNVQSLDIVKLMSIFNYSWTNRFPFELIRAISCTLSKLLINTLSSLCIEVTQVLCCHTRHFSLYTQFILFDTLFSHSHHHSVFFCADLNFYFSSTDICHGALNSKEISSNRHRIKTHSFLISFCGVLSAVLSLCTKCRNKL